MAGAQTRHEMAKILQDSYGDRAALEAARREREARDAGETIEAEDWSGVREMLKEMQGPRQG